MNEWHCAIGNTQFGPISLEQLLEWINQGRVGANDLVWRQGMAQWQPASQVPELTSQFRHGAQPLVDPGGAGIPPAPGGLAPVGPWRDPRISRLQPHRGGAVLALGIIGLVCCFICGIIAWAMGAADLKEMNAGRKDPAGRGTTQAGMICGIIGVALWGLLIILQLMTAAATGL